MLKVDELALYFLDGLLLRPRYLIEFNAYSNEGLTMKNSHNRTILFFCLLSLSMACIQSCSKKNSTNTGGKAGSVGTSEAVTNLPKEELPSEPLIINLGKRSEGKNTLQSFNRPGILVKKFPLKPETQIQLYGLKEYQTGKQCQKQLAPLPLPPMPGSIVTLPAPQRPFVGGNTSAPTSTSSSADIRLKSESDPQMNLDLRGGQSIILQAKKSYYVEVTYKNTAECSDITYSFQFLGARYPRLPNEIVCQAHIRSMGNKPLELLIRFSHNDETMPEISLKNRRFDFNLEEIYSRDSVACGFQWKKNQREKSKSMECNDRFVYDGKKLDGDLGCDLYSDDIDGVEALTAGKLWVNLLTGEGELNCSLKGQPVYDINLSRCHD